MLSNVPHKRSLRLNSRSSKLCNSINKMCSLCKTSLHVGCCFLKQIISILILIAVALCTSHIYFTIRVKPSPQAIPYFKGPLHFRGVSLVGTHETCEDSSILWKDLPTPYTQLDGVLSWKHSHPMTAILVSDSSPNFTSLTASSMHYAKYFVRDKQQGMFHCDIRLSQNSALHFVVNSHQEHKWNLTLVA